MTIGCPIRNRDWILSIFLDHIYNINYPKKLIDLIWILNDSNDKSKKILNQFKMKYNNEYNNINILTFNQNLPIDNGRITSVRENFIYTGLANVRNFLLEQINTEYFLSVDSDILVQNNILNKLLFYNKHIVSSLIYNGYTYSPSTPYKYPNILNKNINGTYSHIVNYWVKYPDKTDKNKLIEVDCTGAITLMSNEVCKKTKYDYNIQGEDIAWSESVIKNGFKLYNNPSTFSFHIMNNNYLKYYLDGQMNKFYLTN